MPVDFAIDFFGEFVGIQLQVSDFMQQVCKVVQVGFQVAATL